MNVLNPEMAHLQSVPLTFFYTVQDEGREYNLYQLLDSIKHGEWADKVAAVRNAATYGHDTRPHKLKLPAVTVSALYNGKRRPECQTGLTGLAQLDFDHLEAPATARDGLVGDPYTLAAFLSPSGTGLKVIARLEVPLESYVAAYQQLCAYYEVRYGLTADPVCKDISRHLFVSHDPALLVNPAAVTYRYVAGGTVTTPMPKPPPKQAHTQAPSVAQTRPLDEQVEELVSRCETQGIDLTVGYEQWRKVGFALASGFGEGGRSWFHRLSRQSGQYEQAECDSQYTACTQAKGQGIGIESLFHLATNAGVKVLSKAKAVLNSDQTTGKLASNSLRTPSELLEAKTLKNTESSLSDSCKNVTIAKLPKNSSKTTLELAENSDESPVEPVSEDTNGTVSLIRFLKSRYEFRYNTVRNTYVIRPKGSEWQPYTDRMESNIIVEARRKGYKVNKDSLNVLVTSDHVSEVHRPFEEYFESLPVYRESEGDHIARLCTYVQTTEPEVFALHLRKHLVRAVACALTPYVNKHCLVLVGGQNTGKTTFTRWLCPPELGDYLANNPNFTDKDGEKKLSQSLWIVLDELAVLGRTEINRLKEIFTKDETDIREAYMRKEQRAVRRASFIGSTNDDQFLVDHTGNTRWVCFDLLSLNFAYKKDVDINRVWAQAYDLYRRGYKADLSPEEVKQNEDRNRQHLVLTAEAEIIQDLYVPSTRLENGQFRTATEIYEDLCNARPTLSRQLSTNRIGRALKQLGFERVSVWTGKGPKWGYYVKPNS